MNFQKQTSNKHKPLLEDLQRYLPFPCCIAAEYLVCHGQISVALSCGPQGWCPRHSGALNEMYNIIKPRININARLGVIISLFSEGIQ